jgi:SAM-dependent methyltransferase
MMDKVNLYDGHYGNIRAETYLAIRQETYGEDLGQASWITKEEFLSFLPWLNLNQSSKLLEVACGSGGVSLLIARESKATVIGIDINEQGIRAASERATSERVKENVTFQLADGGKRLPFSDAFFNAIFCNDSINHLPNRPQVLREWHRLLKPGGKLLYTDPIVVTGQITNEEIAIRSSIGFFLYTPIGENERLPEQVGFNIIRTENVTANTAQTSRRWYEAREHRKKLLKEFEGKPEFEGLQRFFHIVHELSSQGRLSRYAYLAQKQG